MTKSFAAPLPELSMPAEMNYVGIFLSFSCNLACGYCINDPAQEGGRDAMATGRANEMSPEQWVRGLNRLRLAPNLPITLQGGEPTLYGGGRGLGTILENIPHPVDLLTNLALPADRMARCLNGQAHRLHRDAPYPSIRVSYHPDEMDRAWGDGIGELIRRCESLAEHGLIVSPHKAESDVGIYLVDHPANRPSVERARAACAGRVPFETKEFLGVHDGILHGHYRYPHSTDLLARGTWPRTLSCRCRTTELLIDPLGFVWPCHLHLYDAWMQGGPRLLFQDIAARDFHFEPGSGGPIGHMLDPDFRMDTVRDFRPCGAYGRCIGCDTKIKNDRFQSLTDRNRPHTSVEIRDIAVPEELWQRLSAAEREAFEDTWTKGGDDAQ